jgi:hypothetical protein
MDLDFSLEGCGKASFLDIDSLWLECSKLEDEEIFFA